LASTKITFEPAVLLVQAYIVVLFIFILMATYKEALNPWDNTLYVGPGVSTPLVDLAIMVLVTRSVAFDKSLSSTLLLVCHVVARALLVVLTILTSVKFTALERVLEKYGVIYRISPREEKHTEP